MKLIRKIKTAAALLLTLAMLFASGCSSAQPPAPGEASSAPSGESQSAPESGSAPESSEEPQSSIPEPESSGEEEPSREEPSGRVIAPAGRRIEGTELYEITGMIPKHEDMTLMTFAMQGQNRMLLVYKAGSFDPDKAAFTLSVLDLETGAEEILADHTKLRTEDGAPIDFADLILLSTDPPLVIDRVSSTVFDPEKSEPQKLQLGTNGYVSDIFSVSGQTFCVDTKGNLYRLETAREQVSAELLHGNGLDFTDVELWEVTGTQALLRVTPLADAETDYLLLSVALENGEVQGAFSTEESLRVVNRTFGEDCYAGMTQTGSGEWILYAETADGNLYVSDLPKSELPFASFAENGYATLGGSAQGVLCFLLRGDGQESLYLWDYAREQAQKAETGTRRPYDLSALPKDSQEFALSIEERFGIDLVLRDEALEWEATGYEIEPEYNEASIFASLSTLQKALRSFPQDFFRNLGSGTLRIGIVSRMNGADVETVSQAGGLTGDGDPGWVLLHSDPVPHVIYHELGHVIFNKLVRDGYSSELMGDFNELNPPGFIYYYSYDMQDENYQEYTPLSPQAGENYENVYFVSDYAKTSNTEDVAEMMSSVMNEETKPYLRSEHLQKKYRFLFELIREDCAEESWPEKTVWEQRLDDALN